MSSTSSSSLTTLNKIFLQTFAFNLRLCVSVVGVVLCSVLLFHCNTVVMFLSLYGLLIVRSNHEAHALNKCETLCAGMCAWIPYSLRFIRTLCDLGFCFVSSFLLGEWVPFLFVSELRYLDFFFCPVSFAPKLAYLTMFYVCFSHFFVWWISVWVRVFVLKLGDNEQILNQNPKVMMIVRV